MAEIDDALVNGILDKREGFKRAYNVCLGFRV